MQPTGGYGGVVQPVYMMPMPDPNQPFMPPMGMAMPQMVNADGQMVQFMPVPMRGVRWPDEMNLPPDAGQPSNQGNAMQGMPAQTVTPSVPPGSSGEISIGEAPKDGTGNPDEPPAPQTLTRAFSVGSGAFRINWTVSATKLRSADKNAVSPPFELSFGGPYSSTKFKLMLFPKVSSEGKGGSSFRKSKGKGFIQLKCEADLHEVAGTLKFRLFVGSQQPRGPVTHDFSHSAVKGLPKESETWDIEKSVTANGYFVVGAEIIPRGTW